MVIYPLHLFYRSECAAVATATNGDGSVNVNFALPQSGTGVGIPINFVITSTINGAEVDRSADIYYSYNDPNIDSIIVSRARFIDPLNNNSMQIYWSY